jgi:hypothetical protein
MLVVADGLIAAVYDCRLPGCPFHHQVAAVHGYRHRAQTKRLLKDKGWLDLGNATAVGRLIRIA